MFSKKKKTFKVEITEEYQWEALTAKNSPNLLSSDSRKTLRCLRELALGNYGCLFFKLHFFNDHFVCVCPYLCGACVYAHEHISTR